MAGINEFLPFGTAGGADVIDQPTYSALPARTAGFSTGTAVSSQLNKVWRQSSFVAAALGQLIVTKRTDLDASDNGNLATFVANFLGAIYRDATLTGTPTVPSVTAGDNSNKIAPTSFVAAALANYRTAAAEDVLFATKAPLASPALSGVPTAPTAAVGTNTNQLATMAAIINALSSYLTVSAATAAFATIAQVNNAQNTANNAQSTANTANSTANTALTNANAALATFPSFLPNIQGNNSSQRGYAIGISTGGAVQMPAGGLWFYSYIGFQPDGRGRIGGSGFANGGTVVDGGGTGLNYGWAIKVS